MKKGQVWTFDMALSLMIFFSALISVTLAWNYISGDIIERQGISEMQLKSMTVSDSLIRTSGIPSNWNESTVTVLGLAESDNVLNAAKVSELVSMSYSKSRSLLDISPYEYYFEVTDINGTVYTNTSQPISPDASIVIPALRYATYNERIVKVTFALWV